MIKKFIAAFCFLFSLTTFAQQGTASPYSYYGVGDIKFKGTVENRSMEGLSVFPDSIHMNLQNPAHFASLKLTNLTIGGSSSNLKLESETYSENARRASLDYFAAALPFNKLGVGFGAIPYSSVGYKIQEITPGDNPTIGRYDGIGGVNKVFLGFGYQLTKNINIGADFQYNFGNIETTSLRFQEEIQYGTKEYNKSNVGGYNFDFGITYQAKLNPKLSLFTSLLYTPQAELNLDNTRSIQIIQFVSNSTQLPIETSDVAVADTKIQMPTKIAFGTGFGQLKKWMFGAEVTYFENSVLSNRNTDITGATFENSMRYNIGGYYIPNYSSYRNYFKRMVYRAGFRFENNGLVVENKSIEDYAASFGVGLPIGGTFTNINLGMELGRRGTTYNGLIRENYFNFFVGFSFSDRWFQKRKID